LRQSRQKKKKSQQLVRFKEADEGQLYKVLTQKTRVRMPRRHGKDKSKEDAKKARIEQKSSKIKKVKVVSLKDPCWF
jgi:hypothetical protein